MSAEAYCALRKYIKDMKRILILSSFHQHQFHEYPLLNWLTLFHNALAALYLDDGFAIPIDARPPLVERMISSMLISAKRHYKEETNLPLLNLLYHSNYELSNKGVNPAVFTPQRRAITITDDLNIQPLRFEVNWWNQETEMISVASLLLSIQNLETKVKWIRELKLQDADRHECGLVHRLGSYSVVAIYWN